MRPPLQLPLWPTQWHQNYAVKSIEVHDPSTPWTGSPSCFFLWLERGEGVGGGGEKGGEDKKHNNMLTVAARSIPTFGSIFCVWSPASASPLTLSKTLRHLYDDGGAPFWSSDMLKGAIEDIWGRLLDMKQAVKILEVAYTNLFCKSESYANKTQAKTFVWKCLMLYIDKYLEQVYDTL